MGRRLVSKAHRVNANGEMLVNFSADRDGGAQVGRDDVDPEVCVPFITGGSPLKDRKHLVLTFPTDLILIGRSPVPDLTSYFSPGTRRGNDGTLSPNVDNYSNRRQFLRGQYLQLALRSNIEICARAPGFEFIASLEIS